MAELVHLCRDKRFCALLLFRSYRKQRSRMLLLRMRCFGTVGRVEALALLLGYVAFLIAFAAR